MGFKRFGWMLVKVLLAFLLVIGTPGVVLAQVSTTTVTETVYHADGTAAGGTLLISWPAFTAANGATVAAGSLSVTIGSGGAVSVGLAPNAGSTPIGSYYTVVYHLDDGSQTKEYWTVPVSTVAVPVSAIRSTVLPLSVAMQTVSKAYVDTAIATAVAGHPLSTSTPYVLKAGDTMEGALILAEDPVDPMEAADKEYVDGQIAGVTTGLGQKVSTVPSATQVVTQPVGTELAVNILNGVEYASQYVSGSGNNGIANAASSADCASGCEVTAEKTYPAAEAVVPANWNEGTHVSDHRGGAVVDTYRDPQNPTAGGADAGQAIKVVSTRSAADVLAQTSSTQPFSIGLKIENDSVAGGSNLFPEVIQGSVPYFKSTYSAIEAESDSNTLGQHVLMSLTQNCFGVGDCLIGGQSITSSGGFRDDGDEGAHPFDLEFKEDTRVFEGTCASGCTTGSTSVQVTVTADGGTQGEGRYLIDTNGAKTITSGVLTGGSGFGSGNRQPVANFSGTSFAVSTLMETAQVIPTQSTVMAPGTVTVAMATSGVPAGFQTNTAALPAASGVACVTDVAEVDGRPLNYEMAAYTTVDGSHLQMTLNKAHASGATVAVGGLCGYGLEQTVDTSAGIRQVFPVVGSTSSTSLLYAGGVSSILGVQGNTSAYLNVNETIASVARSGNVVTVTTAGSLPVDVNGLTLTVAGVADSSYDGSFAVTTTGPNTLSYAQTGANSTSTGGTVALVTGGYALYPMAEVLGVYNTATKAVDGLFSLAANTVAWASGDTVEEPHYFQQKVVPDQQYFSQVMPRPTIEVQAGMDYQGNNGPGLHGWQVANATPASSYLGNGGTHTTPDVAFESLGAWTRSMSVAAGERAAFAVHCNSHGCGRWDSTYNLFELDSSVGVDTMQYVPTTSTLNLNLRGTGYTFSPSGFTAGTINVGTLNAGTITGTVSPGGVAGGDLAGSYPNPTVGAVHATSGTLNGVTIGATNPAPATFKASTIVNTTGTAFGLSIEGNDGSSNGSQAAFVLQDDTSAQGRWHFVSRLGQVGIGEEFFPYSEILVVRPAGAVVNGQIGTFNYQNSIDMDGNMSAPTYAGPSAAPTGACASSGVWVFSQDGHATFCAGGTWVTKI